MTLFSGLSILIVLSAVFGYTNLRVLRLPPQIGIMLLALVTSILFIAAGKLYPPVLQNVTSLLKTIDFSELLMGSMLSFMLFAGAIHIKMKDLQSEKFSVMIFSTISVLISTFLVGIIMYYLLAAFAIRVNFIHCLLFGSLISPTDPIAVLGVLKDSKVPKSLETKIAGESLFNDGVAVVIFLTILEVAEQPGQLDWSKTLLLFVREALGGIIWGMAIGYLGFLLMRSVNNYKIEVLITLAVVMGGYSFAHYLHISGPLAMVVAGIFIGNQHKLMGTSKETVEYLDKFWELTDEILNGILFVLIGLELLIVNLHPVYMFIGIISIFILLCVRFISVFLPAQVIRLKEDISKRTIFLLTWGGLRGGISIALALSLKPEMQKDLWVTLTYMIVAFSILVQGLTVGKLAKKLK